MHTASAEPIARRRPAQTPVCRRAALRHCHADDLRALEALFACPAVHADRLGAQLHGRYLALVDELVDRGVGDLQGKLHRAHVEPVVRGFELLPSFRLSLIYPNLRFGLNGLYGLCAIRK